MNHLIGAWRALFVTVCLESALLVHQVTPLTAAPGTITVTTPASGATVSGEYTFTVETTGIPTVASVEYKIGSLALGVVTTAPFSLSWNTGFGYDGNHALQVFARDASGTLLASTERIFNIQNHGVSINVISPDITQTLSGTVALQVQISDAVYYPRTAPLFIDGKQSGYWDTGSKPNAHSWTAAYNLDTTQFANGQHELEINMAAVRKATRPDVYMNFEGALNRMITINNGHLLQEIKANALHAYVQPGQTLQLSCRRVYTDGASDACVAPTYSSATLSAATVSASGLVSGVAKGFSDITVSDSGKITHVYVWVNTNSNIPHFAGNGQLLNSYQSGTSVLPLNLFQLSSNHLINDANLVTETKKAAINTLGFGFYLNPRSTTTPYRNWKAAQDNLITSQINYAKNNGLYIYATGDDGIRRPGDDAWWTFKWSEGQNASTYAMQTLANSGVAIAVDVVDEATSFWGWYPTNPSKVGQQGLPGQPASFQSITCSGSLCTVDWPNGAQNSFHNGDKVAFKGSTHPQLNAAQGNPFTVQNMSSRSFSFAPNAPITGTFTASNDPNLEVLLFVRWTCNGAVCNPYLQNDAVQTYSNWMHAATPRVPIAWPALGVVPPVVHANWIGQLAVNQGISDFGSHYWDSFDNGRAYPWGASAAQRVYWMRKQFYDRQPYMAIDRPQVMLISGASYAYRKNNSTDAYYNPLTDTIDQPGTQAKAVTAEMMSAVAMGNSALRQYMFELNNTATRAAHPAGSYFQTGMRPDSGDWNIQRIWRATGYTDNVLTRLQPFVLGQALNSPALGSNIVTAVRQGSAGKMLMVVNANDVAKTSNIDLTAYQNGNSITRYIVSESGIQTSALGNVSSDSLNLKAGATVLYLFPSSPSTTYLQNIPFTPSLPAGATTAYLHHAYIYAQDLDSQTNGIDCTAGCSLALDTSLGDVQYHYYFTDATGVMVSKSAVHVVPKGTTR